MLRTHTCGELTIKDVGKTVTLCGWVGPRRDHGNIIFIDLRDGHGLTQIVFNQETDPRCAQDRQELRAELRSARYR